MQVVAATDHLAICEWQEGGATQRAVYRHAELLPVTVMQQAQQPQAPKDPDTQTPPDARNPPADGGPNSDP
jgi:hypothetical protein